MVDENRLAEAFRDAVGEMPPASFDTRDVLVVSARARARARRRAQVGGGVALGVVLLGGMFLLIRPTGGTSVASAPPASSSALSMSTNSPGRGGQAGKATPDVGGGADTRQLCGPPDQGLGNALVTELTAAAGAEAQPADVPCPAGSAGVAFQVSDGTSRGTIEAVLVRPDPGTGNVAAVATPSSATAVTVRTRSGSALTLVSRPMEGASGGPYASQLGDIAARLATHY